MEQPATQIRIGAPAGFCWSDRGEDLRLQRLEDLRVPEERGDVDEDVLVERADLVGVPLEQRQVALESVHAAQRHPAGQAPLEGRRLVLAKSTPTVVRTTDKIRLVKTSSPSDGGAAWISACAAT